MRMSRPARLQLGTDDSRRTRLGLFLVLGTLTLFTPLSIDMYLPALPTMAHDLHAGASEVQLTLTTFLIGMAAGQLLVGPLSDAAGRRAPLRFGIVGYALASLLCAVVPSVYALVALRLLQGFAGAAGVVVGRAIVRDLFSGIEAARYFSLLMLITGLGPIIAPTLGGQLLRLTSWRGIFVVLGVAGLLILVAVEIWLPETLHPERRRSGGLHDTARAFRSLLGDRTFVAYCLGCGLGFATLFAYISGSSFVLQGAFGISPQQFGLIFGLNGVAFVTASQVNRALVRHVPLTRLLVAGQTGAVVSAAAVLAMTVAGHVPLAAYLPPLYALVVSVGFVMPNSTALALSRHARAAGTASALLGSLQMAAGAGIAPLVGVAGSSAYPMAITMLCLGVAGLGAVALLARPRAEEPEAVAIAS
jgi:MFS transporter, DHA1 family, multidrug resistance protein